MTTKVLTEDINSIVTSIWTPWTDDNIPTEKAVRDAIVASNTTTDIITFNRDISDATGVVNYAHSLWVVPKLIIIQWLDMAWANPISTDGRFVTWKNMCLWNWSASWVWWLDVTNSVHMQFTTDNQVWLVQNPTTTDFEISRTLTGTPVSAVFNFVVTLIW